MKILLALFIIISTFIFGIVIYPERCVIPITKSFKAFYDIKSLTSAVNKFKNEEGYIPESLENLKLKYIRKLPGDPWGNKYIYALKHNVFRIYSLGSDGKVGGVGGAADIDINDNVENISDSIYKPIWGCNA